MMKKTLALIAISGLAFSLGACKGEEAGDGAAKDNAGEKDAGGGDAAKDDAADDDTGG